MPVTRNLQAVSDETLKLKHTKKHMEKITKKTLESRLQYLENCTGKKFTLSAQCSGNGRGYSFLDDQGRHAMTYGHVPASVLDACTTAFTRGFYRGEEHAK